MNEEELEDLTGYQRKAYQAKWLKNNHYAFELDKDGKPKVLRDMVLAKLGSKPQTTPSPKLRLPANEAA